MIIFLYLRILHNIGRESDERLPAKFFIIY